MIDLSKITNEEFLFNVKMEEAIHGKTQSYEWYGEIIIEGFNNIKDSPDYNTIKKLLDEVIDEKNSGYSSTEETDENFTIYFENNTNAKEIIKRLYVIHLNKQINCKIRGFMRMFGCCLNNMCCFCFGEDNEGFVASSFDDPSVEKYWGKGYLKNIDTKCELLNLFAVLKNKEAFNNLKEDLYCIKSIVGRTDIYEEDMEFEVTDYLEVSCEEKEKVFESCEEIIKQTSLLSDDDIDGHFKEAIFYNSDLYYMEKWTINPETKELERYFVNGNS